MSTENLRRRVVARDREFCRLAVKGWEKLSANPLPMPTDQMVRIIGALTDGLLIAHWQSPVDFDEALIVSVFETLGTDEV